MISTKKSKKPRGGPILMDILTLIRSYVEGLLEAEDRFIEHLDSFPELEKTVVELSNRMAAGFLGAVLTTADAMICESGVRKKEYTVQRKRMRTLISSVGDVTFTHTLYKDKKGQIKCLLDEQILLPDRERFTTLAEAKVLSEAEVHSYQHAADSIRTGTQAITKTTVMNKIHAIEKELPEVGITPDPEERKQVEYLYLEADEDHIHKQKDRKTEGCFIGKLVYLFEGKKEICKGRRKLIAPFYFGGLYSGSDRNAELWKRVEKYIQDHYDQEYLKRVYICSDGGAWIKAALNYIYKGKLIADRFHLMKYIYRVANCTLDDRDITVGRFYKYIYKNRPVAVKKLLTRIQNHCENSDRAVEACSTFMLNNWEAIQAAFHDKHALGCSAEGHVSSIYSERMSSRPMGWSETGSDRMCKLRCYVRNYGQGKIIELVRYRREQECLRRKAVGCEELIDQPAKARYTVEQRRNRIYIERMQATLQPGSTARKILAIREQIGSI